MRGRDKLLVGNEFAESALGDRVETTLFVDRCDDHAVRKLGLELGTSGYANIEMAHRDRKRRTVRHCLRSALVRSVQPVIRGAVRSEVYEMVPTVDVSLQELPVYLDLLSLHDVSGLDFGGLLLAHANDSTTR